MSDLIRRDELLIFQLLHTECHLQENKDRHLDVYKNGWNDALKAVHDNAPAIDAVEVVRCQHCVNHYDCTGVKLDCCLTTGIHVDDDDFCSKAERRTDG